MNNRILTLLFVLSVLAGTKAVAQIIPHDLKMGDTTQVHYLTTVNKDILKGTLIGFQDTVMLFQLASGFQSRIPVRDVKQLSLAPPTLKQFLDPYRAIGANRFPINQTAYLLKKRQLEYTNTMVVISSLNYGVTDNFNIGLSIPTFPVAAIAGVNLKAGTPVSENMDIAASSLLVFFPYAEDIFGFHLSSVQASFGSPRNSLTAGLGVFGTLGSDAESFGTINLGGQFMLFDKLSFQIESVFLRDNTFTPLGTAGLVFHSGPNRIEANAFFIFDTIDSGFGAIGLPIFSYSRAFRL